MTNGQAVATEAAPAVAPPVEAKPDATPEPPAKANGKAAKPDPKAEAKTEKPADAAPPRSEDWNRVRAAEARATKVREESEKRAREAEAKAKAAEEKASSLEARAALIDKAKAGDWEAREALLKEGGVTYDELTKRALAGKANPTAKLAAEIAELKASLAKRDEEATKAANESAKASMVSAFFHQATKVEPDKYPLLAGEIADAPAELERVLRDWHVALEKRGESLSMAEACERYESYLLDQTKRRAARMRPATTGEANVGTPDPKNSEQRPRDESGRFAGGNGPARLTNGDSAERSSAPQLKPKGSSPKTLREKQAEENERLRRAAAAMGSIKR